MLPQAPSIEDLASAMGLDRSDLQQLTEFAVRDPVLSSMDSELLCSLTRDFHCHTWQVLAGDSCLTWTRKGSRGSSWADSVFAILFERILWRRERDFRLAIMPSVPWDERRALGPVLDPAAAIRHVQADDVIYADDLALLVLARLAADIGAAVAEPASGVVDTFSCHALQANFGRQKTAGVVCPHRALDHGRPDGHFFDVKGHVPVLSEHGSPEWLELVPTYRHLGTVVSHTASMVSLEGQGFSGLMCWVYCCSVVVHGRRW